MNDDLEGRLEGWGSERALDPDPTFATRVELDLRSQAYETGRTPRRVGLRNTILRPAVVFGASLMLLAGAWVALRHRHPGRGGDE